MDLKKVCALLTGDAFLPFYGVDNNFFKIGDDFFEAVEDEDDGYRSCMDAVVICAGGEYRHNFFKTPVANVKAVEGDEETIKLIDESGHVWLEFGTDHSDSYYPSFVFRYRPTPWGGFWTGGELPGSFQGGMDHARALKGLGYEIK